MKSEFALAFNEIAERSRLETKTIIMAVELALEQAYRKSVTASDAQEVVARVEPESGQVSVFAEKEVVDDPQDDRTEVALSDRKQFNILSDDFLYSKTIPAYNNFKSQSKLITGTLEYNNLVDIGYKIRDAINVYYCRYCGGKN